MHEIFANFARGVLKGGSVKHCRQGLGAKIGQNGKFAKFSCRENFMLYSIWHPCSYTVGKPRILAFHLMGYTFGYFASVVAAGF